MEILLTLLQSTLLFPHFAHFVFFQAIDFFLDVLFLRFQLTLIGLSLSDESIVLGLFGSKGVIISVIPLDGFFKLFLFLSQQSFHLIIHIGLGLVVLQMLLLLLKV